MKEVILHVGMHKTGTTSIQASLDGFDDGRTRMARLGDLNHSVPVTTMFSPARHAYYIHTQVGRGPAEIDALASTLRDRLDAELRLPRERLLLSGEDISLLESEGVAELRDVLLASADRVRVLAYVRDPIGFASSAFQQYVTGGKRELMYPAPEYRNRFGKFVEHFGADSLEFVRFRRDELTGGSVVPDFCERCGIAAGRVKERQSNESVAASVTRLVFELNRHGVPTQGAPGLIWAREQLIWKLMKTFEGPGLKLPAAWVIDRMDREDVRWMETLSGLELMPTLPAGETAGNALTDAEVEASLVEVEADTIARLRELVAGINVPFSRSATTVELLNLLFLSLYFSPGNEARRGDAAIADGDAGRAARRAWFGLGKRAA